MTRTGLIQIVLALRALAIAVFPLAAILLAVLQRSWAMVALLALAMLAASHVERLRLARLTERKAQPSLAGLLTGTLVRSVLLLGLFVVCTGVLALFRDTSLARTLGPADLGILLGALTIAIGANEISARIAGREAESTLASFQATLNAARGEAAAGEIIEGELIPRKDDPASQR